MFCLRHPADAECFDQWGRTKPACVQPGCKGKHAVRVHQLLGGVDASVNLVAEEDREMEEDEDLYVNIARIGQEEDDWQEPDDSWLELDGGDSEEEAEVYCISACLRKDDSGLEDELGYFHDVRPAPEEEGAAEVRWWSPEPQGLQSEEEDEEKNQYLVNLLTGGLETRSNDSELTQSRTEPAVAPVARERKTPEEGSEEEKRSSQEDISSSESPTKKKSKRRMPRKKEVCGEREKWETARRDAWLRELLTDSSGGEDGYTRFEESSRWIAEMTGGAAEAGPVGPRDASSEDFAKGVSVRLDARLGGQEGESRLPRMRLWRGDRGCCELDPRKSTKV
jgi:hypothetical protein